MARTYGAVNARLTDAVRRVARADSSAVAFTTHAQEEMENDQFDHADVMVCLRKGVAFGPETVNGKIRANVEHRGLHIRVVVGGLDACRDDRWEDLASLLVVTVMKNK